MNNKIEGDNWVYRFYVKVANVKSMGVRALHWRMSILFDANTSGEMAFFLFGRHIHARVLLDMNITGYMPPR